MGVIQEHIAYLQQVVYHINVVSEPDVLHGVRVSGHVPTFELSPRNATISGNTTVMYDHY